MRKDGHPAADTDLLAGDQIQLTLTNGQVTEIDATSRRRTVSGVLALAFPVGSQTITLTVNGTNASYPLAPSPVVIRKDGQSAANDDLWVGDPITLTLVSDKVTQVDASSVTRTVRGFVTSVVLSATSPAIGVTAGSNPEQVFRIPAAEPIYQGSQVISISAVPLGAYVELTATGNIASRVTISNKESLQELAGVIVAANATSQQITLAVTDQLVAPSGAQQRVVRVLNSTIIIKHGTVSSFTDLKVGDRVMAAGVISSEVYTAQTLVVTFTDAR